MYGTLRRIFLPFLIVAVPIAALLALPLYHKKFDRHTSIPTAAASATFGNTDWPFCRGDSAQTGTASGQLPEKLTVAWKFRAGDAIKSTPIVAHGTVFVTSADKKIYALSAETGSIRWSFTAADAFEAGAVFLENNIIIAGATNGILYACDVNNGAQLWTYDTGGKITAPANIRQISQAMEIYVGNYDGQFICLDAATGQKKWSYSAQSYINGSSAVGADVAVFGSCDANLYVVNLNDPNETKTVDGGSYIAASPAIFDNKAFVGTFEGRFFCIDIKTGQAVWSYNGTEAFFSSPAVNKNNVIVGCRDKKVYCFNTADGTLRWTFATGDSVDAGPVICGDKVLTASNDGKLYTLTLTDGKLIGTFDTASAISSGPAVASNRIYVAADDGTLYALAAK